MAVLIGAARRCRSSGAAGSRPSAAGGRCVASVAGARRAPAEQEQRRAANSTITITRFRTLKMRPSVLLERRGARRPAVPSRGRPLARSDDSTRGRRRAAAARRTGGRRSERSRCRRAQAGRAPRGDLRTLGGACPQSRRERAGARRRCPARPPGCEKPWSSRNPAQPVSSQVPRTTAIIVRPSRVADGDERAVRAPR